MKKNILLLILLIPFLFGCNAEYELTINNNEFKEKVIVFGESNSNNLKRIEEELKYPTFARESQNIDLLSPTKKEGSSYYDKKKYEQNGNVGVEYSFSFDSKTIYDSLMINKCYELFSVINERETIILSTNRENKCFINSKLNSITVNINTNHKVKDSNADSSENNNFFWTINKQNYNNKSIYIELYKNEFITERSNIAKILLGVIGIAILIFIVIIWMKRKAKNINKV